jgi:tRNA-dihydrouridine synthase 1
MNTENGQIPAMTLGEPPATKKRKLQGREFYKSIGSPTTIVAPMVEQSELVMRIPHVR